LIFGEIHHTLVGALRNAKDMWGAFASPLSDINFHRTLGVDGKTLVRIDGNAEKTGVGIDKLVLIPDNGVPQNASITQVCQSRHVIGAIELWRIYLCNLVLLENFSLFHDKK